MSATHKTAHLVGSAVRLALTVLSLPVALVGQVTYQIGPPPPWVSPIPLVVEPAPPPSELTVGSEMLLVDVQHRASAVAFQSYSHVAYRLIDQGAVQEGSQIELVFDPSYQELTLHAVTVSRDGRSIDQLVPDRIHLMQRESQLEFQTYDGTWSVVLLLEDVRRGDIVEYSFTRDGANPVFAGHYMTTFHTQSDVPLHRLHFRLLWPKHRTLFTHAVDAGPGPVIRDRGAYREYVWDRADVLPKFVEPNVPVWYDPFPKIQLSDFATWSDVAAWGDSLFRRPATGAPALDGILDEIRANSAGTLDRVRAALRFVQDEIRYLGIEIGANSHVPHSPATVLERRYGDCKDKSLLLITMLRQLGIEARPALVSSTYSEHIRDFHPTAQIFDHAIVHAQIDGTAYWLDPSLSYQGGEPESVALSYGAALVLAESVDSLSTIVDPKPSGALTNIRVQVDLPEVGSPSEIRVQTEYRGRTANRVRQSISGTSMDQLERQYLDFYAEIYPSIESLEQPQLEDNETQNILRTTESYAVPEFWYYSEEFGEHVGDLYPLELARLIPSPTGTNRTMPLRVAHPTHILYTIEAHSKEGWFISPEDEVVETPAVRFVFRAKAVGELLTITYDYETLADHVTPSEAADHIGKMERIKELLAYSVTPPSTPQTVASWLDPGELNWLILLTGLFVLGTATLYSVRVYRLQPASWPHKPAEAGDDPRGLEGWLLLVGLGVAMLPFVAGAALVQTLPAYTASSWSAYTTPGSVFYHALWAPLLIFELVVNLALLVFAVLQALVFFQRKRVFPGLFVILMGASVLASIVDTALASQLPAEQTAAETSTGSLTTSFVVAAIWITYMYCSRRVQNTFVN